jgi:hypothetical protein
MEEQRLKLHKQSNYSRKFNTMLSIRQTLSRPNHILKNWRSSYSIKHQVDSCGIPVQPTWSVHRLLESYTSPKLSSTTIDWLYELSALVPPKQHTLQYEEVKKELEDMVKLVEGVKQVNTHGISLAGGGEKEDGDRIQQNSQFKGEHGQTLLRYAARTENGLYAVGVERRR